MQIVYLPVLYTFQISLFHQIQKKMKYSQERSSKLKNMNKKTNRYKKRLKKSKLFTKFLKQQFKDKKTPQNIKQTKSSTSQLNNAIFKNQKLMGKQKQHIYIKKLYREQHNTNTTLLRIHPKQFNIPQNFRIKKHSKNVIISQKTNENSLNNLLIHQKTFRNIQSIQEIQKPFFSSERFKKQQQNSQFICQVCQRNFFQKQQVRMFQCQHSFCAQCSNTYLLTKLKNLEQLKCLQQSCNSFFYQKSPFFQSLSGQVKNLYKKNKLHYTVLKDQNLKFCPTQNCTGVLNLKLSDLKFCFCNVCKKWICKSCFLQQHLGPCEQHQVNHFQDILHYRQCSKCKIMVQKTQACNHMTCICKHQFCYKCGQTWTTKHQCQSNQSIAQRVLFCLFVFIIMIPLEILIIMLPMVILTLFAGIVIILIGILVGPFVYFKQIFCPQPVWLQIASIIFFPISIAIGIIMGIILVQKKMMNPILQSFIEICNVIYQPIQYLINQ